MRTEESTHKKNEKRDLFFRLSYEAVMKKRVSFLDRMRLHFISGKCILEHNKM